MATDTDTIPVENDTATREATHPPRARPPSRPRRAWLGWAAIVTASIAVAALAVATFTGGDDDADIPATRLDSQAEQHERQAHLEGQAKTYGGDDTTDDGQSAQLAEQYEREAHLEGQAKTHGATASTNPIDVGDQAARAERFDRKAHLEGQSRIYGNADPDDEPSSHDEFVPGSRHMPMR
jgi:hypothetical protein